MLFDLVKKHSINITIAVIIIFVIVIIALLICVGQGIPLVPPIKTLPKVKRTNIDPNQVQIYMVSTPHIGNYSNHSIAINREYALKHGYRFRVFTTNGTPQLPINFGKIQNALDLMKGVDPPEYVVHIDADAVVVKKEYPITAIIDAYMGGNISLLIGEDCYNDSHCSKPGRINSGVFIVKNNALGRKILEKWLDGARGGCKRYVNQFPNCQLVFWHCVMMSYLRPYIKVAPYNLLNGTDGLFIQHLMQHSTNDRIEHFKKIGMGQGTVRTPVY